MMTQFCTLIPYRAALEDIVDEITARAPQACGFEFNEVVIICDGVKSAATVAAQIPFEVVRAADETESLSTRIWIRGQPGIEAEVAALTDQFAADFAAYRIVYIDAPAADLPAIRSLLAGL